ncbi:hypothetical protein NC653_022705 [Populus alba x Populus x berolinensis]|uniref:Uncharacterized protein n=1 Tax=Populus alba x Populus x berolinensis TaxID=444605 RepID=A0AAD6MG20_9ROSI|nr:hypothetical protein NC653_022705 [Populus alba x Populus x berolinensis]
MIPSFFVQGDAGSYYAVSLKHSGSEEDKSLRRKQDKKHTKLFMLSKHPKKLQQSQKFTLASSIDKSKTSWPHHNSQELSVETTKEKTLTNAYNYSNSMWSGVRINENSKCTNKHLTSSRALSGSEKRSYMQ